jgi:hypothetical protein
MQQKSLLRIPTINPFVLLLSLLLSFSVTHAQDWYDTNWQYRKAITIDPANVDNDLTSFPLLIDITDTDLSSEAHFDGDDILFTGADGTAKLDHEIESYAAGNLVAWVSVPLLSSTEDTQLYMYYGNSAATNQENAQAVWDSNYVMVQHLDETSGTHYDSTSNGNDGTAFNLASQNTTGKIDGADEFDATGDLIDVGIDASLDVFGPAQDFSIFLWVKRDTLQTAGFFSSGSSGSNGIFFGSASANEDDLKFMSINNTVQIDSTTDVIGDTEWHHVGVTADRDGNLQFWVDGVPIHAESIAGSSAENWNRADDTYKIGTDRSENGPMDGIIDEVRVSDILRGSGWISTSYTNQQDPSGFAAVGNVQLAHVPIISNENPADGATSIAPSLSALSFHLLDPDGDLMDYTVTTNPDIGSGSATGVTDGTYTVPVAGLSYNTTYEWTLSVTDGTHPVSELVTFTTESDLPIISQEDPPDGAIDVQLNPTLKADILDEQGDSVDWEILININDTWQLLESGILPGGVGTVSTATANMDQYSTAYSWRVQARDSGSGEWVIETYTFTTLENKMNFAAFTDNHVGSRCETGWGQADYLDLLGQDVIHQTVPCEFAVNLGDLVHTTTAQLTGVGLPGSCDQYKNNLKAFHIQHLNLPFHIVSGNHDECDYRTNSSDPYKLTRGLINETGANTYPYAMMRNGILFLTVPEMSYIQWTSQYIKEWVEYMVQQYPTTTTIILAHQAIEDTTRHDNDNSIYPYRGKQDTDWWAELFRNNVQIKMWIHGHQHWLDWYQGSQSSGRSHPVYDFGHEMVFSHPYSGTDWGNRHEEDRIVIYTISSTGISTRAWENNGTGGQVVTGYDHEWQIPTTYDDNAEDWYSYPVFIQDGETQLTDMKVLSSDITLELIGTKPVELFFDEQMSTTSGWAGEVILSFANDQSGVTANTPGMTVTGQKTITFPPKNYRGAPWEDGKSAQPYNFFPMGVTPRAVPGATYQFTLTAKANSGTGTIRVEVSASDWGTGSQYSTLAGSLQTVLSHEFGTGFETLSGTYTVPADGDAWFLQGSVVFEDATDYEVTLFSITRVRETDTTDDFEMVISGTSYNVAGTLLEDEKAEFSVDPVDLAQSDGVISFSGSIGGNHYGMARLIYHGPILMGRNARFRVNSASGGVFDVTLTDKVSGWPGSVFKIFPFSITDSDLSITASDGSDQQHVSSNGNVWVSTNTPDTEEIDLVITYEALAPTISEESPADGATDVALNTALQARIRDLQGDTVDWEIKSNASGSWTVINQGTNTGGDFVVSAFPTDMNEYGTTYQWSVHAIDIDGSNTWTNKTFSFTTRPENYQPVINDPSPENGALNASPNPTLSAVVSDGDGDLMEITFETDVTGSWQVIQTYTDAESGNYSVIPANMNEYSTTYNWRVTADDGNGNVTTETYSFTTETEPGVWWDSGWLYRKAITIDHTQVDEDLVEFPVLIAFTDSEVAAHAQTDADDIAFTDYFGVPLSHEIEEYESSSGHLVAWVEVPFLSSSIDTTLYMYYGNSGAANQEDVTGTWDGSNHVMVQHLEEASGTHYDATGYHNDSNTVVVTEQNAAGSIDGADEFDGADDYVRMPNAASLQFGEGSFTAEAWIYPRSVTDTSGARIVNNRGTGGGGSYRGYQLKIKNLSGNWHFSDASIDDATGNYKVFDGTNTYAYNQWYQVVMVYDADSELRFYVNGYLDGALTVGAYGDITNSLPTAIGASLADQGVEGANDRQFFDGIIDEVRLSEVARSAGWIQTSYTNQQDPSAFYLLGGVEIDTDPDGDGIPEHLDNCPEHNNPGQEDTYPPGGNGAGDACDCEGDFNCDGNQDASDVSAFLTDFGRTTYFHACSNADPCKGDFNCDENVDAADFTTFIEDFGRNLYGNPCPACVPADWCVYVDP